MLKNWLICVERVCRLECGATPTRRCHEDEVDVELPGEVKPLARQVPLLDTARAPQSDGNRISHWRIRRNKSEIRLWRPNPKTFVRRSTVEEQNVSGVNDRNLKQKRELVRLNAWSNYLAKNSHQREST